MDQKPSLFRKSKWTSADQKSHPEDTYQRRGNVARRTKLWPYISKPMKNMQNKSFAKICVHSNFLKFTVLLLYRSFEKIEEEVFLLIL